MLKEKVVFVTGGARGIGYGIACAALEAGAQVAIGDLHEQAVFAARGIPARGNCPSPAMRCWQRCLTWQMSFPLRRH